MKCIFGFGGWNTSYFYLIIAAISKLIKEDFLVGDNTKISFNLNIKNHKIMILLLGYMSEAFFGLLILLITNYKEYRRKRKKNLILSQQGIEYQQKSTLDMIKEMKNKAFENSDIFNFTDSLKKRTSDEQDLNPNTARSSFQNRKVSLIHTNIAEDISDNSYIFIILCCCLILTKEFLNQIVYSTNDIFDYYFLNLVILTLILKFWFHENIYRHRLLAVIMVIIVSSICLISCLFINNYPNDENQVNFIEMFRGEYYKIFIIILLYIIMSCLFCVGILIQKNLMEYRFISPYKIILYKGIIGILVSCICLIISSNYKCNEDILKGKKDITEMKIFEFYVCSNNNTNNYYYDHFTLYFTSFHNERTKEAILLIIYCLLHFSCQISLILINKFLSPTHYLIAESTYSLMHIPLHYLTSASYEDIKNALLNKKENIDFLKIYNVVVHTFGTRILKFIACFFDSVGYIIYLEIIELKFWGLNKNIKKNIQQRATIDGKIENDENSGSDSDDEKEKNNEDIENKEDSF